VWDNTVDASGVIRGVSHRPVNGVLVPFTDASVIVLRDASGGGAGFEIHAIDGTGRRTGEIVWLVGEEANSAGAGFSIRYRSSSSLGFTRFAHDSGIGNAPVRATDPNKIVPIMFVDRSVLGIGVAGAPQWFVVDVPA
jgi:hypothetical protein